MTDGSLIQLLLEALGDLLLQAGVEILAELGLESLENVFRPRRSANLVLATGGVMIIGAVLGLTSGLLLPGRVFPAAPVPGLSLVLAPVGMGITMHLFGQWRRARGGRPTFLATFPGGAAFAFSWALVRWVMVAHAA